MVPNANPRDQLYASILQVVKIKVIEDAAVALAEIVCCSLSGTDTDLVGFILTSQGTR